MLISKIAYLQLDQNLLDGLIETLNGWDVHFVEKIESEHTREIWVKYSNELTQKLVESGFVSKQDKSELVTIDNHLSITDLLFY